MAPAFTAETRTLAELLRDPNVLQVPDYQRAFSWTTKEAGQLIDDLMVANAETADPTDQEAGYFLGAVLLMAQPPSGAKSIGATTPPLHCFDSYSTRWLSRRCSSAVSKPHITKIIFVKWWFRYAAKDKSAATQPPGFYEIFISSSSYFVLSSTNFHER